MAPPTGDPASGAPDVGDLAATVVVAGRDSREPLRGLGLTRRVVDDALPADLDLLAASAPVPPAAPGPTVRALSPLTPAGDPS